MIEGLVVVALVLGAVVVAAIVASKRDRQSHRSLQIAAAAADEPRLVSGGAKLASPGSTGTPTVAELEQLVRSLTESLSEAQETVRQWTTNSTALARSAAEARAENQGRGKGAFAQLLGPKYRSMVRTGAAASNASIARKVADQRRQIFEGKSEAQDLVRSLKDRLGEAQATLKAAQGSSRTQKRSRGSTEAADSLDLLAKLKAAHADGLLTDAEFEDKRKKVISEI